MGPALSHGACAINTALLGETSKGMLSVDGFALGCVSHQREKCCFYALLGLCLNLCGDKYQFHYGAELSISGVFPVMQCFIACAILSCFSPLINVKFFSNDSHVLM